MDKQSESTKRMPTAFLGHGTPLNLLRRNSWTEGWERIGAELGRPKAILCISGHWCTRGVGVTAMEQPPTIHDFNGFPRPLHEMNYPAPGSPRLAERVRDLLAPMEVHLDQRWGFDHGTWLVLAKAYPSAEIPVVQLSIDLPQPPRFHFEVGRRLATLRAEGVLILGSGNVVHNLWERQRDVPFAYDWARRFNDFVRESLLRRDWDALVDYTSQGEDALRSVPTPDHYYPLLYACGAAAETDPVSIEIDAVCDGSMSMMSVVFGEKPSVTKPSA